MVTNKAGAYADYRHAPVCTQSCGVWCWLWSNAKDVFDQRGHHLVGWDPRKAFKVEDASSCTGTMVAGASTDDDLMRQTFTVLERYDIQAVTSSGTEGDLEQVSRWRAAAPDRIIPAASFLRSGNQPRGRLRSCIHTHRSM